MKTKILLMSLLTSLFFACGDDSSTSANRDDHDGSHDSSMDSDDGGHSGDSSKDEDKSDDPANGGSSSAGSSSNFDPKGSLAYPSNKNQKAAKKLYDAWIDKYYIEFKDDVPEDEYQYYSKSDLPLLKNSARIKWDTDTYTVSEGIGYGMLLTVFFDDQDRFEKLMNYYLQFRVSKKAEANAFFMKWKVQGFKSGGSVGSASDADIDIVAALLVAYEKWGKKEYKEYALQNAGSIYASEINKKSMLMVPANDGGKLADGSVYNISYFSLSAFHMLEKYDSAHDWKSVAEASIKYIAMVQDGGHGLWPDWSNIDGEPEDAENGATTSKNGACAYYGLEGVRIPYRLLLDYYWYGDKTVKSMIDKAAAYAIGSINSDITKVKNSYIYKGDDPKTHGLGNVAFRGSFCALGLADKKYGDFLNKCNETLLNTAFPKDTKYFAPSMQLLYVALINGMTNR